MNEIRPGRAASVSASSSPDASTASPVCLSAGGAVALDDDGASGLQLFLDVRLSLVRETLARRATRLNERTML